MVEVEGRQILTTLREKVRPRQAAVVVIDMQKDFTSPGLSMAKRGRDLANIPDLVARLKAFLDGARRQGVFIVHVAANYDPAVINDPMYERMHRHGFGHYCVTGTRGMEFEDGLEPGEGEPVVVKHRFDAFYETDLDMRLRARGIRTVIPMGVAIHGCVYATLVHAYFNGYYVVLPRDLTGLGGEVDRTAAFESVERAYGVTTSAEEILAAWTTADDRAERIQLGRDR